MPHGKIWTEEEMEFLEEKWGVLSVKQLARKLGRTTDSIIVRARKMQLGRHVDSDDRVLLNQIAIAMGFYRSEGNIIRKMIRAGLPYEEHKVRNGSYRVIPIEKFWKWAEQHRDILNFRKMEFGSLGPEPPWVDEKRRFDRQAELLKCPHNTKWTPMEEKKLERMTREGYTSDQISKALWRPQSAITRRIYEMGLGMVPKRTAQRRWTRDEVDTLLSMRESGADWLVIAKQLERTQRSVAGKYERLCNPEYMRRENRKNSSNFIYTSIREIRPAEVRRNMNMPVMEFMDAPPKEEEQW